LLVASFTPVLAHEDVQTGITFDKPTSYRYVYYAYAAYNQPVGWTCSYCVNYTKGFVNTNQCDNKTYGSYAYVGYHPSYNEIVASFRGSSDIPNWIEDIDAIKTPPGQAFPGVPNAQVEVGFWAYYQSLKSCVLSAVKTLKNSHSNYVIHTTGHSLGAAGATLFAMDLEENLGYSGVQTLNFGSPRVGNKAFSDAAASKIPGLQRMTDNKDCVPGLPPKDLGYYHEVTEVWEHPAGADTYKICSATDGEDPTCGDSTLEDNCDDHLHYMGVQCCDHP